MDRPMRLSSRAATGEFELAPGSVVPFADRAAVVEFLRRFGGEGATVAGLRKVLTRQRGDVSQLSDDEVLGQIATLVMSGRWHITRCAADNSVRGPGFKKAEEPRQPAPRPKPAPEQDEEAYVLVAEIKSIGGTLLVDHPVRILDPDTEVAVIERIHTDDQGVVRTLVPRNKTYRIEILDEEWEPPAQEFEMDTSYGVLHCRFVDEAGAPLANLGVEARQDGHEFQLVTDEDGWIESPASLGAYELQVGDQVFLAHALLPADVGGETGAEGGTDAGAETGDATGGEADGAGTAEEPASVHYEFVVTGTGAQDDGAEQGEEEEHRLCRDADVLDVEADGAENGDGDSGIGSGIPELPDAPGLPDVPEAPDVPSVPDVPEAPDVPSVPDVPDAPDVPSVPDAPSIPEGPGMPDAPEVPSNAGGAADAARREFAA